jgi:hypothetical protein
LDLVFVTHGIAEVVLDAGLRDGFLSYPAGLAFLCCFGHCSFVALTENVAETAPIITTPITFPIATVAVLKTALIAFCQF